MTNIFLYSKDTSFVSVLEEHIGFSVLDNLEDLTDSCILIIDFPSVTPKDLSVLEQKNLTILAIAPKENLDCFKEIFPSPVRLGYLIDRLEYYVNVQPLLKKTTINLGSIILESKDKSICLKEKPENTVKLTEKEFALLELLAAAPMQRQDILNKIWGYDERIETKTLETHVYQLRKKLEKLGVTNYLLTNNGLYYLSGAT
ncbi:MAG: winged helix-turn-helix domain-containing protein [Alphaproteobacteria bacterium]|nr:winged helix-turn-helix domain-containing protein [Alphaproteobacteria bacterium]MCL2505504.1 winged helix-turn-helix domain-containing protein [Alphaproteobacteria bacterium]